jgi:hypothetical protein
LQKPMVRSEAFVNELGDIISYSLSLHLVFNLTLRISSRSGEPQPYLEIDYPEARSDRCFT